MSASGEVSDRSHRARAIIDDELSRIGEAVTPGHSGFDEAMILSSNEELAPELQTELRKLRLIEQAQWLAGSAGAAARPAPPDIATRTLELSGYDVVRRVSAGGQGTVFEAVQTGTKRRVAVKLLRDNHFSDSRDQLRFEREVRILAALKHPGIVAIHESGTTDQGHYFVMDFVDGESLDTYFARGQYSVNDALGLMMQVCDAVNQAHLRGVIHRDLKAGNILVDAADTVHVLDFGLAKFSESGGIAATSGGATSGGATSGGATSGGATSGAPVTITGQFVGSLPWASPEQAGGLHHAVDIRTDVYSLGVLLYGLLTDHFPYPVVGNIRQVVDNIMNVEPIAPSSINAKINNEVETIVLKCLKKDPARRYQSAGELRAELDRYLRGDPIEAKRDSAWYLVRKILRRHRVPATLSAVFAILLVAFAISMSLLYGRSQVEAEKARRVQGFLQSALLSINPAVARGRDTTLLRSILSQAEHRIDLELTDQPEVAAAMRTTIGLTYLRISMYDAAHENLTEALSIRQRELGPDHADTWASMNHAALLLEQRGEIDKAQEMFQYVLGRQTAEFGSTDPSTLTTTSYLGVSLDRAGELVEAEKLKRFVLHERSSQLGDDHPLTLKSRNDLAVTVRKRGQLAEAAELFRESLDAHRRTLGDDHPETLRAMHNVAVTLEKSGHYAEAAEFVKEILEVRKRILGSEHRDTLWSMNSLAVIRKKQGKLAEARAINEKTLQLRRGLLGDRHPDTLISMTNLANTIRELGLLGQAEELHRTIVAIRKGDAGVEHPDTLAAMNNLGVTLQRLRKTDEAFETYEKTLGIQQRVLGHEHPETLRTMDNMAIILGTRAQYEKAEELHRSSLRIRERVLGDRHPHTLMSVHNLGDLLGRAGKLEESASLLRRAWQGAREVLGAGNPETLKTMVGLAKIYARLGRLDEAGSLFEQALDRTTSDIEPDHPTRIWTLDQYAGMLSRQDKWAAAADVQRKAFDLRRERLGEDHAQTLRTQELLALSLRLDGRDAEAQTLVEGLIGRRRKLAKPEGASRHQLNACAWLLLTCEPKELRDPPAALAFARRAVALTGRKHAGDLDTLALALHENRLFDDAARTQQEAIDLLPSNSPAFEEFRGRLDTYLRYLAASDRGSFPGR